jgi:glucose-6-phosphate isomerase
VILLDRCDPYAVGQLLALYEHRTAVQGFVWGLNSFDQMGVELGKVLAKKVRGQIATLRKDKKATIAGFNPATTAMIRRYL